MPETAAFEVIGGPMDGLGCLLRGPATAGRKVGNALSLALDDQVSGRHLEMFREGHLWCVRDLGSTNGTLLAQQRLEPGRSYPIGHQEVILLGSTVLLFSEVALEEDAPVFGMFSFDDPLRLFSLGPELARVWEGLVAGLDDAATANRFYCDTDRFFLAVMNHVRSGGGAPWACEQWLAAAGRYQILSRWLNDVPVERNYQGESSGLTVAPRLWQLFEAAAGADRRPVTIPAMLTAMVAEGRSLAARHIANDSRFLTAFRAAAAHSDDEAAFVASLGTAAAAVETTAPAPLRSAAPPPDVRPEAQLDLRPDGECEMVWAAFGRRLETLITGFVVDATSPVTGRQQGHPPGLKRRLDEVTASPRELAPHLDSLYTLLVAILAAQRDGCKAFAEHFLAALEESAAELKDNRGLGLALGKKSLDVDEWLIRTKTLLGRLESEGMSDTLIRESIRNKIAPLGLEPSPRH